MASTSPTSTYMLGSTEAEHQRLIRQAAILAPFTERLFRDAGIGPGQRVLDIGAARCQAPLDGSYDILCSVRPQMQQHGLSFDAVGDFETLLQRLEAELMDAKTFGAYQCLVGAWSRRPVDATRG